MGCFRLLTENFADDIKLANYEESSEQTTFPVENSFSKRRRAKLYRTGGYWNIVSGSNTIVFSEDGGTTKLTATITPDEYRTTALLLAEIKTQLEAISPNSVTYTVDTNTTTGRIQFTSDGAGGATFDLHWTEAASSAMAGILGFDTVSDDSGSLGPYQADLLRISTEEFIVFDLGLPTDIDAFVAVGRRNSDIPFSPSATLKLQGSHTDSWTTPVYENTLVYNKNSIIDIAATSGLAGTPLRYWRFSMSDVDNANLFLEISSIFLGNQASISSGRVQFPLSSSLVDRSSTQFSTGGQAFSVLRQTTQRFDVKWLNLKKEEIETMQDIFDEYGTGVPFFVVMDLDEVWSSSQNSQTKLVRFADEPRWTLLRPNFFEMNQTFLEEI